MDQRSFGGIDPGKDGCLAIIRPDGGVEFHDVPTVEVEMTTKTKAGNRKHKRVYDIHAIVSMLRLARLDFVTIEKVQAMPSLGPMRVKMGAVSAFASGEGYGIWQGVLAALGISHQIVHAARWKAQLLRDQPKTKEAVVPAACRMFPAASPHLRGPRGALLIDRADALMIAEYGRSGLR